MTTNTSKSGNSSATFQGNNNHNWKVDLNCFGFPKDIFRNVTSDFSSSPIASGLHSLFEEFKKKVDEPISDSSQAKQKLEEDYLRARSKFLKQHYDYLIEQQSHESSMYWGLKTNPFILTVDATKKHLFGQKGKFFWVILAPFKVVSKIEDFKSLDVLLESRLEEAISKYCYHSEDFLHLGNNGETTRRAYPVDCCAPFERSLSKIEILSVRRLLHPLQTTIIQSKVTAQKVFVTMAYPFYTEPELHNNYIALPAWKWKEAAIKLQDAGGKSEREAIQYVMDFIVSLHVVIALYFIDFYCIDTYLCHDSTLVKYLEEDPFSSEELRKWAKPLYTRLGEKLGNPTLRLLPPASSIPDKVRKEPPKWVEIVGTIVSTLVLLTLVGLGLQYCSNKGSEKVPEKGEIPSIAQQKEPLQFGTINPLLNEYVFIRSSPGNRDDSSVIGKITNTTRVSIHEKAVIEDSAYKEWLRVKIEGPSVQNEKGEIIESGWVAKRLVE